MAYPSLFLPSKPQFIKVENSFGYACPITEITPEPPANVIPKAKSSSPEITKKSVGLFFNNSKYCCILFPASLIPTMFSKSFAKRIVVPALMFFAVLPGTLYKIIGTSLTAANALKC